MIKRRLLNLPDEIYKLKISIIENQEKVEKVKKEIEKWEIQQLDEISNVTDDKGKVVFSNDTKRKAELERRKVENANYLERQKILNDLVKKVKREEIELDKLYNEQGNLRAICKLEGNVNG